PVAGDYGLDAVDVALGGEILFSMNEDVFSEKLEKNLGHGDILSAKGRVHSSNQQLLAAFDPDPTADAGLDALLMRPGGEIWFSIRSDIVSRAIGAQLFRGDLLSSKGVIVKSNQQLLSRFHPAVVAR